MATETAGYGERIVGIIDADVNGYGLIEDLAKGMTARVVDMLEDYDSDPDLNEAVDRMFEGFRLEYVLDYLFETSLESAYKDLKPKLIASINAISEGQSPQEAIQYAEKKAMKRRPKLSKKTTKRKRNPSMSSSKTINNYLKGL